MRAKRVASRVCVLAMGLLLVVSAGRAEDPYGLAWTRQFGTTTLDDAFSVAVGTDGNVYVTGHTYGDLAAPNAGSTDTFLAKYDTLGTQLWTRQLGTASGDTSRDVAVGADGNVYITGETLGDLGGPHAGGRDPFLAKYDTSGALTWTRQFGTTENDYGFAVSVDAAGSAYIAGRTEGDLGGPNAGETDPYLAKYDASGALLWTRQPGTTSWDDAEGVAVDGDGNVYVAGHTGGSLGGPLVGADDAFLLKYDPSGTVVWTRQLGTTMSDIARDVAVDASGGVYIAGHTHGDLGGANAGGWDVFLAKYDPSGTLAWTAQVGSAADDWGISLAVDAAGNAYITGGTEGDLGGAMGDMDGFLVKFDASGALVWTRQIGTSEWDRTNGVAVDATGAPHLAGTTEDDLGGPSAGSFDAFAIKLSPASGGDSDFDGDVDFDDFLALQIGWGSGPPPRTQEDGDYDADGDVDFDDFLELQINWTGAAPVPEPATLLLLGAAAPLLLLRRPGARR